MVYSIKTDVRGQSINHQIYNSDQKLQEVMQRLSTGLRINKAGDDAAGLEISERLKAQSRGLTASNNNLNDAISLVKTAGGGLSTVSDILQRVRELTVQGRNGTLSPQDKSEIDNEISKLLQTVDGISKNTTFNGINLLSKASVPGQSLGSNWTPSTNIPALNGLSDSTSNGTIYVAVKGGQFLYSTDGSTWSNGTGVAAPASPSSVIWDGSQFVVGSSSGIYVSKNGQDWSKKSNQDTSGGIAFNGSTYVSVKTGFSAKIYTSSDLSTWTQQTYNPTSMWLNSVSYESGFQGGKFLIKNLASYFTSSDGITWTQDVLNPINYEMGDLPSFPKEITQGPNGTYYAAAGTDGIYSSTDHAHWSKLTNVPAGDYQEIEYNSSTNELLGITTNGAVTISQATSGTKPLNIHSGTKSNDSYGIDLSDVQISSLSLVGLSVTDPNALQKIDTALQTISSEQSRYGTIENRLNFKLEDNSTSNINTQTANQRISEADMSAESSELVKEQIKNSTALAMLSKNNQYNQSKIALLQG